MLSVCVSLYPRICSMWAGVGMAEGHGREPGPEPAPTLRKALNLMVSSRSCSSRWPSCCRRCARRSIRCWKS